MTSQLVAQVIAQILAPVVMVSACAVLLTGILNRYLSVGDRLRQMAHERLELLVTGDQQRLSYAEAVKHPFKAERLREIDHQLPDLQRRHLLLHNAVLIIYGAILFFIACMFMIAWAVSSKSSMLANFALWIFLAGTAVLLCGLLFVAIEVRVSAKSVQYESARVLNLGK
jgi:hypothetical protein